MFHSMSSGYNCSNQFNTNLSLKSPLLSSSNRAILDTTEWLNDTHMDTANKHLKESFPAVDGLHNPVLQQNMSFNAPKFEFAQFLLVNKSHIGSSYKLLGKKVHQFWIYLDWDC